MVPENVQGLTQRCAAGPEAPQHTSVIFSYAVARRAGISRVRAATTSSSAPICSVLRSKARPYPWLSAPKNSTPVTATPTELPTCWAVPSAPDTDPAVAGSAWLSTGGGGGGGHSPCPAPSSSRPGNSQATDPPVPACAVARYSAASPSAAVTAPAAITDRPNPMVSAGAPNEVSR